jgi:N-acetylneuraminic acid mutarotase
MRSRDVPLKALLALGLALLVVPSRDHVFGQGGRWTAKAPMLTPRSFHAVGVVDGILYAVGGATLSGRDYLDTVEAYDPTTNKWTAKARMPTPREGLAVGVVDGILYAIGGISAPVGGRILDTVEAYDPRTDTWTVKAPMPTHRSGLGVGVVNGILYAVGGMGGVPLSTVEAFDPIRNKWTTRTPMPRHSVPVGTLPGWEGGRHLLGVGVVGGILYAVGGACCAPGENGTILGTVEAYDPATDTWRTKASIPTPRYGPVAVANGILYAVGGVSKGTGIISTVEAYNPTTNAWLAKPPMPVALNGHAVGVVKRTLYALGGLRVAGSGPALKVVEDGSNYAFEVAP